MKKIGLNKKKSDPSMPDYPSEKKIYFIQNRERIIERRIIIALVAFLVILAGYIAVNKYAGTPASQQYKLRDDSLNSKYLDNKKPADGTDNTSADEEAAFDYSKSIICWGDSFSDNNANSTNFYTYYLSQKLMEVGADIDSVFSSGLEGDLIPVIAAKQGGIPMLAQPMTIPAAKESVPITLKSTLGGNVILQDKLNSGLNPCTIAGVEGVIDYRNGVLSFTRQEAGKEVKIATPTTVVTNAMANIKDYTAVYFFGGDCTKYTPNELVSMYKKMIAFNENEKYVIIGSITGSEETLSPYEQALTKEFKSHYINLRAYLTSDVFNDYEIEITANDAKALRTGSVPPSFVLNGKRLSDQGSEILANLLFDRLLQLELI